MAPMPWTVWAQVRFAGRFPVGRERSSMRSMYTSLQRGWCGREMVGCWVVAGRTWSDT